jgi:hypothetical protein
MGAPELQSLRVAPQPLQPSSVGPQLQPASVGPPFQGGRGPPERPAHHKGVGFVSTGLNGRPSNWFWCF